MSLEKDRITTALAVISKDRGGRIARSGNFMELFTALREAKYRGEPLAAQYKAMENIGSCIWDLETVALKLAFLKSEWEKGNLNDTAWAYFAQGEIEFFLIAMRSAFDFISSLLLLASEAPGQMKQRSFQKLRNWILDVGNIKRAGADVTAILNKCDWFEQLRALRDAIVHNGAETIIFTAEKGRILFLIVQGSRPYDFTSVPCIMYNENVADFEMFAAMYYGYFIALLEEVSMLVLKKTGLKYHGRDPSASHPGIQILQDLMEKLLALGS